MERYASIGEVAAAAVEGKTVFISFSRFELYYRRQVRMRDCHRRCVDALQALNISLTVRSWEIRIVGSGGRIIFGVGHSDDEQWRRGMTWDGGMYA
jgi:hypothetical protein